MFFSRNWTILGNNRIYKLHERSLRIVYNDHETLLFDLLEKDDSFNVHIINIQTLLIEIY